MNEIAYTRVPTEFAFHCLAFAFVCGMSAGGILALAVTEFFEQKRK